MGIVMDIESKFNACMYKDKCSTNQSELESLRQQLAVRDLEVMQLRGGLSDIRNIAQKCKQSSRDIDTIYMKSNSSLSNTFTPDYLREWLGEEISLSNWWALIMETAASFEVASYSINDIDAKKSALSAIDYARTNANKLFENRKKPLYAPKLEIK